jgi:LmbE family N-acetylglucosaminyl deacetylase
VATVEAGRLNGGISLGVTAGRPLRVLALGAHSDDIEIGCAGMLLSLIPSRAVAVHWIVFSAEGEREAEAQRSAEAFLQGCAEQDVRTCRFRDGFFPTHIGTIKEYFEQMQSEISPDLILTHRLEDRHQDHRVLAELTWNTFRNHTILEYEIPKYEGDLGQPNVFVPLDPAIARRKVELLMEHFGTQRSKRWFNEDVFTSVMRLRGMEAGLANGLAEGFYARKLVLG